MSPQMKVQTIRFGMTLWAFIQSAAAVEGVSASQFVREAALGRAMWLTAHSQDPRLTEYRESYGAEPEADGATGPSARAAA